MATPDGGGSSLNTSRPDRGKRKMSNITVNFSRKGARLDRGKRKVTRSVARPDCGKRKVSNNTVNLSRKGTKPDRGKRGLLECNLSSDLWATLPGCLVQEILAKLPLSSLLRLCTVCKRWRDLIFHSNISCRCTSDHGHLCLFSTEKLATYHSSRKTWETVPLQFLQLHFQLLDLVSSAGGLLCFSTMVVGKYIICNPLTKSFRRLQMPCSDPYVNAWSISEQPYMPTHSDVPGHLAGHLELVDLIRAFLVGMVLNSDTGHFKFIVAGLMPWSRATTLVYDSHSNLWKKVGNICIPEDAPRNYLISSTTSIRMVCGGNFYAYFSGDPYARNRLYKYDVEEEEWIQIRVFHDDGALGTLNITEFNGKILVVAQSQSNKKRGKERFLVYELQETGPKLWPWPQTESWPFSKVNETFHTMKDSKSLGQGKCLGQGDVMFIVSGRGCHKFPGSEHGVNDCQASPHTMSIGVTECFHNVATKRYSKVPSKYWYEFEGDINFPDLQIFRPSLLGFKEGENFEVKTSLPVLVSRLELGG